MVSRPLNYFGRTGCCAVVADLLLAKIIQDALTDDWCVVRRTEEVKWKGGGGHPSL